jgi:hypothetical protein
MEKEDENNNDKTLLDVFRQGDRVVQICYESNGFKREYSGIVIRIQKHCIAIQWDTINGEPLSNMRDIYTVFHESEVFNGGDYSSPIEKENN